MNPITVKLPNVKGPGGRKGWNKLVVGVKGDDEFQGEYLEGDTAEMLSGDLLLCVKPMGGAHEKQMHVSLLEARPGPENLRLIRARTDWLSPDCKASIAATAQARLRQRPTPEVSCPACDAMPDDPTNIKVEVLNVPLGTDCAAIGAVTEFFEAARLAVRIGATEEVMLTLVKRALAERTQAG